MKPILTLVCILGLAGTPAPASSVHAGVTYDAASHTLTLTVGEHTLASVAEAANAPEVFAYDAAKRTAWCRANLALAPGATLTLDREILRMDCAKGEFKITVERKEKDCGSLFLTDSVVAPKDLRSFYAWDVQGRLDCRRSEIVGADCLFLRGAEVTLEDVTLESFGHHASGGSYSIFYIQSAEQIALRRLTILDGSYYAFHLQSHREATATTRDSLIEGLVLVRYSGRWEAINTAYRAMEIQEYQGGSGQVWRKWYLDVQVVDEKGKPIPDATVEVVNNLAAEKYPPQNLAGEKLASATTGDGRGRTPAGHTPLPSDNPAKSFMLTDYHQFSEAGGKLAFEFGTEKMAYTVRASKGDKGVSPYRPAEVVVDPDESWYRPDPDRPTKTCVVTLTRAGRGSRGAGERAIGQLGNWATGQLGNQVTGQRRIAELPNCRIAELPTHPSSLILHLPPIRLLYNNLGPQQTKEAIDLWLSRAEQGKFTGVTYPVGVFRTDYTPQRRPIKGFDPITYFVSEAHRRKMKVFAWWAAFFSEKTAQEKGFTLPVDVEGKTPNIRYGYCPNDPADRALIRQLLTEFLSAYGFDGITYDDGYGYPPGDVCYCANCLSKFKKERGDDPRRVAEGPQTFSREELAHFRRLRKAWGEWRVQQVTEFARFVRNTARRIKPKLLISSSGSGSPGAWRFFDQMACLKAGIIDYYEPELYFATPNAAERMAAGLAQWKEALGEVDRARVSPTIYGWMNKPIRGKDAELPKTAEELLAEVRLIEEAGMSLGFFDDRALTEEQTVALATGAPPSQAVPDRFLRTPGKFNVLLRGFVDDDHYQEFLDRFRARGAAVKWYSGLLSPELLRQFDLYVELPVNVYTDAEAEAVVAFVKGGGCVFLMGGDYQNRCVEANVFLSPFGLTFTGGCGSPVFQKAADHPLTVGLTKVHGLGGTGIEVKESAVGLLQDGSTFGLACWEREKGRIVVLCDEWPLASFGNDEENLHSPHYDHRRLAENLVAWLMKER